MLTGCQGAAPDSSSLMLLLQKTYPICELTVHDWVHNYWIIGLACCVVSKSGSMGSDVKMGLCSGKTVTRIL